MIEFAKSTPAATIFRANSKGYKKHTTDKTYNYNTGLQANKQLGRDKCNS